jgi:hypothetical protein
MPGQRCLRGSGNFPAQRALSHQKEGCDRCKSAINSAASPALHVNWAGGDPISTATFLGFITGDRPACVRQEE